MTLSKLEIVQFRNLQSVSISLHPYVNVFYGANGSGKTSILEAIFFLSRGRPFRGSQARRLINESANYLTVFASLDSFCEVGIRKRSTGQTELRLNGESSATLAEIAHQMPTTLLEPASSNLFEDGSSSRRAILDWGVFHVEPKFYSAWRRYQRALKQRNSLLKLGVISKVELDYWDHELGASAAQMHAQRQAYFQQWMPFWKEHISSFLPDIEVVLEYLPGWDTREDLAEILITRRAADRERGYTQLGPHRADLYFRLGASSANDFLSRGQKKLTVCALKLSQLKLLRVLGIKSSLLIDDLPSELDLDSQKKVIASILGSELQIFVTAIDCRALRDVLEGLKGGYKAFHVEHGVVCEA